MNILDQAGRLYAILDGMEQGSLPAEGPSASAKRNAIATAIWDAKVDAILGVANMIQFGHLPVDLSPEAKMELADRIRKLHPGQL